MKLGHKPKTQDFISLTKLKKLLRMSFIMTLIISFENKNKTCQGFLFKPNGSRKHFFY